ncbi:hypothetical protein IMZ38_01590 [Thermosphaera chiliense]|uniref:Uncharacterized protein n=1 Tax=Thermosphaera chiliense TaxID=3402707 RepID=A0A7M1UUG9_9CREN|nr:hypothetical protein [Thermosphaera aggregans]QOR94654.1 hypothetical protein IMZ38_01590 [Thermosphaera aggregans]
MYKLRTPLPDPKPGKNWVKHGYCSYIDKLVDVSRYISDLKIKLEN